MNNLIISEHFRSVENEFIMDLLYGFGIKSNIIPLFNSQIGGGQTEYQQFIDVGGVYTYNVDISNIDAETVRIAVLTPTQDDCVTIYIYPKTGITILHNMSYFNNCTVEGLKKPSSGNKLLRFSLNLILKNKDKYGIKRIMLKDNSYLYCKGCSETLKLARLRLITHRSPWYSSYGFKPYDVSTEKPSKELLKSIDNSNEILDELKTTDIEIIDLVKYVIKTEKVNVDMNEIQRLATAYPMLRQFIVRLAKDLDKYCCVINYLLKVIYNPETKLGITDFYGKTFYLDI